MTISDFNTKSRSNRKYKFDLTFLRHILLAYDITNSFLAEETGINKWHLSRILKGFKEPEKNELLTIIDIINEYQEYKKFKYCDFMGKNK